MKVAGFDNAQGIITAGYMKDPGDPAYGNDPAIKEFRAFMTKYYPEGDLNDATTLFGYAAAKAMTQVLKSAGDNLTRANIMSKMTNLNLTMNEYLPGVRIKTTPTDYSAINQMQLLRFTGDRFVGFGPIIDAN
jgi:hypothetical protein